MSFAESIAYRGNQPPLTRELMSRFGGKGFLFNLRMWEARIRDGASCWNVPPEDHYRKRFEMLAGTGVALRGKDVPVEMRFEALPMAAVREAAKELGTGKFRTREAGAVGGSVPRVGNVAGCSVRHGEFLPSAAGRVVLSGSGSALGHIRARSK